jgi:hypothetical protein
MEGGSTRAERGGWGHASPRDRLAIALPPLHPRQLRRRVSLLCRGESLASRGMASCSLARLIAGSAARRRMLENREGSGMATIDAIAGLDPKSATRFRKSRVRTTEALLKRAATRRGRKELATSTRLDEKQILIWVNRADLMRVKGIGSEYSDLLESAGVDTIKELRRRNPTSLSKGFQRKGWSSAGLLTRRNLTRSSPTNRPMSPNKGAHSGPPRHCLE